MNEERKKMVKFCTASWLRSEVSWHMPGSRPPGAEVDALSQLEAADRLNARRSLSDCLTIGLPLYAGPRIGELQHLGQAWSDFGELLQ